MKAILTEARPAYRNETKRAKMLPEGTEIKITGMKNDRITGYCNGWVLSVTQDQAEVIEE